MFKELLLTALFSSFPFLAQAQEANSNCGPRNEVIAFLEGEFGESQNAFGIESTNGLLTEIFSSAQTGTWTIVMTGTDGISCIVGSGTDFEFTLKPLPANWL